MTLNNTTRDNWLHLLTRVITPPIFLLILTTTLTISESNAQEITDRAILDLERRLKIVESQIIPIHQELDVLNKKYDTVTNEIDALKQELAIPAGFFGRLARIIQLKERKLRNLLTESKELADKIRELQNKRDPLARQFIRLSDELIDKCGLRITELMKVVRDAIAENDFQTRDRVSKQISALWQLAEKTTNSRDKYSTALSGQEKKKPFLPSMSNDPVELRLGSAILKDAAASARSEAAKLKKQIKELESKKRVLEQVLEIWRENQRRIEEREPTGIQSGTATIPWVFNESATKREIDEIKQKIEELSALVAEYESDAERFGNQSKALEQRALQIEADLKGKPRND